MSDDFDGMAVRALPCPFCGERLVVKEDHHGQWLAHRDEPGPCLVAHMQIFDEADLAEWNSRAGGSVMTDDQLRERLFEVGKPSMREWCRANGVNRCHANEFATGVRGPGSDLLRALGVQRAWVPSPSAREPEASTFQQGEA